MFVTSLRYKAADFIEDLRILDVALRQAVLLVCPNLAVLRIDRSQFAQVLESTYSPLLAVCLFLLLIESLDSMIVDVCKEAGIYRAHSIEGAARLERVGKIGDTIESVKSEKPNQRVIDSLTRAGSRLGNKAFTRETLAEPLL